MSGTWLDGLPDGSNLLASFTPCCKISPVSHPLTIPSDGDDVVTRGSGSAEGYFAPVVEVDSERGSRSFHFPCSTALKNRSTR